jgi:hypothetical protein
VFARIGMVIFFLRDHQYAQAILVAILAITTLLVGFVHVISVAIVWMSYAALSLSLLAFGFGLDRGTGYTRMTKATHLIYSSIEPKCIPAIVILAGANGILFIDQAANRLNLLRWSDVTLISANTLGQEDKCATIPAAAPAPGASSR